MAKRLGCQRRAQEGTENVETSEQVRVVLPSRCHGNGCFICWCSKEYAIVNLDQLNQFEDGTEVTPALLVETGVVKNEKSGIKVLGNGSLDKKLTVKAHKFSASAVEAIDAKGGAHEVI